MGPGIEPGARIASTGGALGVVLAIVDTRTAGVRKPHRCPFEVDKLDCPRWCWPASPNDDQPLRAAEPAPAAAAAARAPREIDTVRPPLPRPPAASTAAR
jgi:hypothetical protein